MANPLEIVAMHSRTLTAAERPSAFPIAASPNPHPLDIARIVGAAAWRRLPPALQRRFEPGHGPATYRGTMTLERSAMGALFARLVTVLGAPLPVARATDAEVVVDVRAEAEGVVWERKFSPRQSVRSVKLPGSDGTVLERTDGGLGMVLDVSVQDGGLVFTSRSFFLSLWRWRLPLPGLLTPGRCRVEHRAIGETRFRFTLTMTHPLWGTTFRQSGIFTDTPECAP